MSAYNQVGPPMQQFTQHLSLESEEAFLALIGENIQSLFSPGCDLYAGDSKITVASISIPLGSTKFLIIENDWADTPKEYLDYYFLSARIADKPWNIFCQSFREKGGTNYKADHMTLHLGAQARVKRIDVYSTGDTGEQEVTAYDAGVLITREDGLRVAIVREESITGFLRIAHYEACISKLLSPLTLRKSLERTSA